jgi:hypothetical protein
LQRARDFSGMVEVIHPTSMAPSDQRRQ